MTVTKESEFRAKILESVQRIGNMAADLKIEMRRVSDEVGCLYIKAQLMKSESTDEYVYIAAELQCMLYTREGVRCIPKNIYRSLIEFNDTCSDFMIWHHGHMVEIDPGIDFLPDPDLAMTPDRAAIRNMFKKARHKLKSEAMKTIREICLYENEKNDSEPSFFAK